MDKETMDYLQHWGIKGMQWGKRRYQNADGSLTPAGKKRYADDATPKKGKRESSSDHITTKNIRKKKVREMTNQELKTANERLNLERNYAQNTARKKYIKTAVTGVIATAATITALEKAMPVFKKYGKMALDKIGDRLLKNVDFNISI